jgi:hypothetical protein
VGWNARRTEGVGWKYSPAWNTRRNGNAGLIPSWPQMRPLSAWALQMLHELDDTPPQQMTALFYQHWFGQLSMTARDLLRVLGHDPDA